MFSELFAFAGQFMHNICTIISFCTYDIRFLKKCLESVLGFSRQIIIPVCDHFYNGEEENYALLENIYQSYPDMQFIEFAYSEKELFGTPMKLLPKSPGYAQHWHNTARLVGFYFIKKNIDAVLFCDVDEIVASWPKKELLEKFSAVRFATYWYFLHSCYRAMTRPDGPLLIKRKHLHPQLLIHPDERCGMFGNTAGNKVKEFCIEGCPLVHHYSWVRTKKELLQKIRSWGHHWERDWENLLQKALNNPFSGTDFIRGYSYETADLYWNPLKESIPKTSKKISLEKHRKNIDSMGNVTKVTAKDVFRLEISWEVQAESLGF